MNGIVTVHLDKVTPDDIRRNERIGGLIDLELGEESKWVLVYRDKGKNSFFVTPKGRVAAMEAAEVLQAMGRGLEEALKKAKNEE